jgi:hypothetical protein
VFSEDFLQKLRQLLDARDKHAEADAAAKAAKRELDEIELEVADMFGEVDDQGQRKLTGTISLNLGPGYGVVKFRLRETPYAQIADEEKLMKYYEEKGMLDDVATEPQLVKKVLNGQVREILDNGSGKFPPGLTYYVDRGMTITRPKG